MWLPTRKSQHNVDPTLSDIIREAHRDGATVELTPGDHGFAIEIDGMEVADVASESFDYPIKRMHFDREVESMIREYLKAQQRHRIQRRKKKLRTDNHTAAEGSESP